MSDLADALRSHANWYASPDGPGGQDATEELLLEAADALEAAERELREAIDYGVRGREGRMKERMRITELEKELSDCRGTQHACAKDAEPQNPDSAQPLDELLAAAREMARRYEDIALGAYDGAAARAAGAALVKALTRFPDRTLDDR